MRNGIVISEKLAFYSLLFQLVHLLRQNERRSMVKRRDEIFLRSLSNWLWLRRVLDTDGLVAEDAVLVAVVTDLLS